VVLSLPTPRGTQDTRVQMPLVRGMRAEDARGQLQRLGLRVESRLIQSPAPKDIVVEQAPAEGASISVGSGVTLSVSAGR
jgi:beta-lactam-binding protein with PASTA domain